MFRKIATALILPAMLFGAALLVMADCQGPWCAGATVNANGAYAQVSGGYTGCSANFSVYASASSTPDSDSGSYSGYDYKSAKDRAEGNNNGASASASIDGTNNHGDYYSASDTAP